MPPVNPQGTRGGLVAGVVVFTVLFVAATIFAIYYGVQDSKAEDSLKDLTTRYREIAIDVNSTDVANLRQQAKSDQSLPEQTALAEAVRQRDDLRKLIGGIAPAPTAAADASNTDQTPATDISDTQKQAAKALAQANALMATAGGKFSADNLAAAVADLSAVVNNLNAAVKAAQADRDTQIGQANADSKAARDAQAKATASVNAAKEALQEQVDADNDAVKKAQDEVAAVKKTFDDEQRSSSTALDSSDKQRVTLANQLDTLQKTVDGLRDRLSGRRLQVEDPIVRRPQGQISTLGDANTVYINLGRGDQILPGMTFEVYDKDSPLPKLGQGLTDEDLPSGKASIEVTRVLNYGSECHVSRLTPGKQIVQGDQILNLIYDRNVKFNFFVFGDFDVANTGKPSAAGADVIKRLVIQWGGKIDPKLDVQTDFVVVGSPPDVPVFSADELKDPINAQNMANAKRASDDYDAIVTKAQSLHVPIMNQNRFLYFTGYFDLAQR